MGPYLRAGVVLAVMMASGVLGSYCRRVWTKDEAERAAAKVVGPGIAAAIVVPLFLSVGDSSIFKNALSSGDNFVLNLFLIAGFCVLAGSAAPTFVNALAERALRVAEGAKQDAKEARQDAESAVNTSEAAAETAENEGEPAPKGFTSDAKGLVQGIGDEDQRKVLDALIRSTLAWRSVGGIAGATGLDRITVRQALSGLKAQSKIVDKQSMKTGNMLYQARM